LTMERHDYKLQSSIWYFHKERFGPKRHIIDYKEEW
jgi:hypothetical protein